MENEAQNEANLNRYFLHVIFPDEKTKLLFLLVMASMAVIIGWICGDRAINFGEDLRFPVLGMLFGFCVTVVIMAFTCGIIYYRRQKSTDRYVTYWIELIVLLLSSGVDTLDAVKYSTRFLSSFDPNLSQSIDQFFVDLNLFSGEEAAWEHLLEKIPNKKLANVISIFVTSHRSGRQVLDTLLNFTEEMHNELLVMLDSKSRKIETKLSVVSVACFLPMFLCLMVYAPVSTLSSQLKNTSAVLKF